MDRKALLAGLRQIAEPEIDLPAVYDLLTPKQRRQVREAYAAQQNGLCGYCQSPLDGKPRADVRSKRLDKRRFPEGFFEHPVHLHHSHHTGLTIGAVHAVCNAVLWTYHGE